MKNSNELSFEHLRNVLQFANDQDIHHYLLQIVEIEKNEKGSLWNSSQTLDRMPSQRG